MTSYSVTATAASSHHPSDADWPPSLADAFPLATRSMTSFYHVTLLPPPSPKAASPLATRSMTSIGRGRSYTACRPSWRLRRRTWWLGGPDICSIRGRDRFRPGRDLRTEVLIDSRTSKCPECRADASRSRSSLRRSFDPFSNIPHSRSIRGSANIRVPPSADCAERKTRDRKLGSLRRRIR